MGYATVNFFFYLETLNKNGGGGRWPLLGSKYPNSFLAVVALSMLDAFLTSRKA